MSCNAFERHNYALEKRRRPMTRHHISPIYGAWVTGRLPVKGDA